MKYIILFILTIFLSSFALKAQITGVTVICEGASSSLSCPLPASGTWTSTNLAVASVSSSGVVTGISTGTATISYGLTPTFHSVVVTVNPFPAPSAIVGASSVCLGSTTTFTNTTSGGTWSSSNIAIAMVGSGYGTVTGISVGSAVITYQLATGCFATKAISVNAIPAAISGSSSLCSGTVTSLSSATPGGTWSSAAPTTLTVHPATGNVSGISAGVGTVTYTLSTGCSVSRIMTVFAMPAALTGPAIVCTGDTTTLGNSVAGGTWSSSAASIAHASFGTPTTGIVTGLTAGTATIFYTIGSICAATRIVTVNPAPVAGALSGPSIVCAASAVTLSSTVSGGTWSSSLPSIATVSPVGVVTGVSPGTTTITYTVSSACGSVYASRVVTVSAAPAAITGTTTVCSGATASLYNAVSGGAWSSLSSGIAIVGFGTGIVTGVSAGTTTISYIISSSCFVTTTFTVNAAPAGITGTGSVCVGSILPLADAVPGGTWGSSASGIAVVASVGSSTGVVTGLSAGTAIVSYAIGGCFSTVVVTVVPTPSVTASATPAFCGASWTLSAAGATTYSWSPATGLSCTTCTGVSTIPSGSVIYTVTGTNTLGCSGTATAAVNGNSIYGHITFSGATPAVPDLKVWLIQYDPSDSSIVATDSTLTCLDGSVPYFQFTGKPIGNYMVKARLLSSVSGSSDYIPTYGASTPNWLTAASTAYTGVSVIQDINMIYGTVPVGTGFISGFVYSGAGKGTAGEVPEPGMLLILKNAFTGQVVTHTYTNGDGGYSFGSLGFGSYIICPEDYGYYTSPSADVILSPFTPSATGVSFKKHTLHHTIYPFSFTGIRDIVSSVNNFYVFPNPATKSVKIMSTEQLSGIARISIVNATGSNVFSTTCSISNSLPAEINISSLSAGIYFIHVQSSDLTQIQKLIVE
ncbi:MAG: Ig-like domain-containing protein [Taibaiella sp.]|nr:Ig-like domain-containing protein [Taibaiella sp.]